MVTVEVIKPHQNDGVPVQAGARYPTTESRAALLEKAGVIRRVKSAPISSRELRGETESEKAVKIETLYERDQKTRAGRYKRRDRRAED